MNQDTFNDLVTFLHEKSRAFEVQISLETSIEDDLGVTGDDAEELIIEFSSRYNVDISSFDFTKYFYPEPFVLKKSELSKLTVNHLLKSIEARRLDEAVINS